MSPSTADPVAPSESRLTVALSVSTFGSADSAPRDRLIEAGVRLVENPHGRTLTEEEVTELLADADGIIAGTEPLTEEVLKGAKSLRVISRVGVGLDNVDLKTAGRLGIAVFNTPDAVTDAAAEMTVAGILAVLRHIHWMDAEMRAGRWTRKMGALLGEKTVGIVGVGRIGRRVAGLLTPFGVTLLGYDLFPDSVWARAHGIAMTPLHRLLQSSDVVSLHTSAIPEIGPILGAQELGMMKKGAIIANTARGELIVEDALLEVLQRGHLAGAYLDTFVPEPYSGPLSKLPNVLLTPHASSYAHEARVLMESQAVESLLSFLGESDGR